MVCPKCGGKTKVTDSSPTEKKVYRRRKCVECGHVFATAESYADIRNYEVRNGLMSRQLKPARFTSLTDEQIVYIRKHYIAHDPKFGGRALARKFKVSAPTIYKVARNLED